VADKLLVTAGAVGFQVKAFVANVDRNTSVDDVGDVGGGSNLSSNKALSSSNISNSVSTTSTIGNNMSTVGIEAVSTGVDGVMVLPTRHEFKINLKFNLEFDFRTAATECTVLGVFILPY
jgi:hypothetical protein